MDVYRTGDGSGVIVAVGSAVGVSVALGVGVSPTSGGTVAAALSVSEEVGSGPPGVEIHAAAANANRNKVSCIFIGWFEVGGLEVLQGQVYQFRSTCQPAQSFLWITSPIDRANGSQDLFMASLRVGIVHRHRFCQLAKTGCDAIHIAPEIPVCIGHDLFALIALAIEKTHHHRILLCDELAPLLIAGFSFGSILLIPRFPFIGIEPGHQDREDTECPDHSRLEEDLFNAHIALSL